MTTLVIETGIGPQGPRGINGLSAYEIAVESGFIGTEQEWIDSFGTGVVGPQGPQGIQGLPGPQGIQGNIGPQGVKGDTGLQGPQGIQGLQGNTGLQGPPGDDGLQGIQGIPGVKGDTGLQGIQGIQGVKGDTGLQGIQGIQGVKGDTGLQGIQGPPGEEELPYSKRVDFVNDYIYIGEAVPGAPENNAVWRIKRMEMLPDGDVITMWADGDSLFDNVWSTRLAAVFQ